MKIEIPFPSKTEIENIVEHSITEENMNRCFLHVQEALKEYVEDEIKYCIWDLIEK